MATIHASAHTGRILELIFNGTLADKKETEQFIVDVDTVAKTIQNLHRSEGKQIKVLIDLNTFEAGPNSMAFDALVELARQDRELVEKTAIFGGSSQLTMLGKTAAYLAGRHNIHFFSSKAESLEWLKS